MGEGVLKKKSIEDRKNERGYGVADEKRRPRMQS